MVQDWGIKVTKVGSDISTHDPRQMMLSSEYQMFKYHGDYETSVTLNPGDFSVTASITHGLGYIPAFLPFEYRGDTNRMRIVPGIPYGIDFIAYTEAWADTDKIYFKVNYGGTYSWPGGWNEIKVYDMRVWGTKYNSTSLYYFGKDGGNSYDGAMRFASVGITGADSINSASLGIVIGNGVGTDRLKFRIIGMDEDNTADWSTGPMGRPQTSAVVSRNVDRDAEAGSGATLTSDVTSIVNEIRQRGGWSINNAIGFMMMDDNSDNDNYVYGVPGYSYLRILISGNLTVNFRAIVFKDKIHT